MTRGAGSGLDTATRRAAVALGLAGALPFIALALLLWWRPDAGGGLAVTALAGYGAVILSFLGGIQWGLGLTGTGDRARALVLSVLPSLLAWAALLLPAPVGLGALAAGFAGQLALDWRLPLAGWFRTLRVVLTALVITSLLAGVGALTAA